MEYKITYGVNNTAHIRSYIAESEAEAIEKWECEFEYSEHMIEFVSCVEVDDSAL